jgi:chromosome segregation ATPase
LALRRVSDQLDAAEKSLLERTEDLTHAISAKTKAQIECESAFERIALSKVREEDAFERLRQLELEIRGKEEERKLADLVVHEYADLVRTLEGRASSSVAPASGTIAATAPSSTAPSHRTTSSLSRMHTPEGSSYSQESGATSNGRWSQSKETLVGTHGGPTKLQAAAKGKPVDSLNEGRAGLQRLLGEFHEQTEQLEKEVARLHEELAATQLKLEAAEKAANQDRTELGRVHSELAKALREDKSAAKMVERYM